ncbi:MAG: RsbRD N-terminal domain-containing protein [Magnetococcales bacterium]|nr:RsbRD N-terminal domain-containing protein [Magnetococcales bacterium]
MGRLVNACWDFGRAARRFTRKHKNSVSSCEFQRGWLIDSSKALTLSCSPWRTQMIISQYQKFSTNLHQTLKNNKEKIIETWTRNIFALPNNPTLDRMRADQLQEQIAGMFESLLVAFQKNSELEIHRQELQEAQQFLQNISASRAKQGFTPTETAMFVFSLKDALLPVLQESGRFTT